MNFNQFETFYWIVELGSFHAAADKLNTTQPAVSARIAKLEEDLGASLFNRSPKKISLTPQGRMLLSYTEKLLELRDSLINSMAIKESMSGLMRIGVSETLTATWFPDFLAYLREMYPKVMFEIDVDATVNMRKDLINRQLDIAFLVGPISEPRMANFFLCNYEMIWIASPKLGFSNRKLSVEEIISQQIFTYQRVTRPYYDLKEKLKGFNIGRPKLNGSSSIHTIVKLIKLGLGIGAIPEAIAANDIALGELVRLETDINLKDIEFTATYPTGHNTILQQNIAKLAVDYLSRK